jgi:hypothetical protein
MSYERRRIHVNCPSFRKDGAEIERGGGYMSYERRRIHVNCPSFRKDGAEIERGKPKL